MKKSILSFVAAIVLGLGYVQAQETNFGIKAGFNSFNITNDPGDEYDSRSGFYAGLFTHIHLSPQFALQPELLYSQKGTSNIDLGVVDADLKLDYLSIPVMVQYMFDNGFRIEAGPQLGFLLNAKLDAGADEEDVKDDFKSVDFGIGAGLGYIHVPSGFGVNARYNLGLTNISESDAVESNNRGFQIGLFYQFTHR